MQYIFKIFYISLHRKKTKEAIMNKDELITYDDGNCDFYANGFDCRDCPLADTCENAKNFD